MSSLAETVLDHLSFVLNLRTPKFDGYGADAFRLRTRATVLRYEITLFAGAPHGLYIVKDDRDPSRNELFNFATGADAFAALAEAQAARRSAGVTGAPSGVSKAYSTTPSAGRGQSQDRHTQRPEPGRFDLERFTPLHPAGMIAVPTLHQSDNTVHVEMSQVEVLPRDKNSLWPIGQDRDSGKVEKRSDSGLYTATLLLSHKQFPAKRGLEYYMIVDTADNLFWMYGEDFLHLTADQNRETEVNLVPWNDNEADWRPRMLRSTVPRPHGTDPWSTENSPNREKGEHDITYHDGTRIYIRKHNAHTIKALLPCWDWKRGEVGKPDTCLLLPYTLAYAANTPMVESPYDGGLGLAVPGSYTSAAQHTLHSALAEDNYVYNPNTFHVRLIHPQALEELTDPKDAKLVVPYLCFGDRSPCSQPIPYSEPINVTPVEGTTREFYGWKVRLESISLFTPKEGVRGLDRRGSEDYDVDTVNFKPRVQFELDTASSVTVLPADVHQHIMSVWLKNGPAHGEESAKDYYYDWKNRDLRRADVVFCFKTSPNSDTTVELRAPAERFLSIRWSTSESNSQPPTPTSVVCPLVPKPVSSDPNADVKSEFRCALGMNFYWCAFVKHVAPSGLLSAANPPYIQLAPQRVLSARSGHVAYKEEYYKIHPTLPPRFRD